MAGLQIYEVEGLIEPGLRGWVLTGTFPNFEAAIDYGHNAGWRYLYAVDQANPAFGWWDEDGRRAITGPSNILPKDLGLPDKVRLPRLRKRVR